jgi:septal ring factor EnvC (AmiA/AmiB activator)
MNGEVGEVQKLEATVAQQQNQIQTLTVQLREQAQTFAAQLKEHATQIQKVRADLEMSKRGLQVVNNH